MSQVERVSDQGCLKLNIIEYHTCKTLLGPCFVSFSIPFFVPGVVLTVVGSYGNERSFPTFGAWHIAGIIILSFATLMLITGILLKCFYKPVISAEIEKHLSPMSSMITGNKNLGYDSGIYCSNSAKLNNKVNHHDLQNSRIVSTHESKTTNNVTDTTKQFVANGAIDNRRENVLRKQGENKIPTFTIQKDINTALVNKTESSGSEAKHISLTSDNEAKCKPRQQHDHDPIEPSGSNTSSSVTKHIKVTADVVAEADIAHASGSRGHSSDGGNEQSRFLPERKRKKKKRRKRHNNLSQQSVDETNSTTPTSTRETLPDLRTRPVLIHDDTEHYHHHNLHVHFEGQSKQVTIEDDNIPESVPADDVSHDEHSEHNANYEGASRVDVYGDIYRETSDRPTSPAEMAYDDSQQ